MRNHALRSSKRSLWLAATAAVAVSVAGALSAQAADCGAPPGSQNLFYNYYVPGGQGGVPAQLYISPRPTPALVGHTYITYQALRPQEYLYHHQRTYVSNFGGGSKTVTHVKWNSGWRGLLP